MLPVLFDALKNTGWLVSKFRLAAACAVFTETKTGDISKPPKKRGETLNPFGVRKQGDLLQLHSEERPAGRLRKWAY